MKNGIALREEYASKDKSYFEAERSDMLQYVPRSSSMILEVGCGCGKFGALLKNEYLAQVWGVDIDEYAVLEAEKRLDKVVKGSFGKELKLPEKVFDCIIFNDVLEHLIDPFSSLTYCKQLLSDKGVIVASIPNVRYFRNIVDLLVYKNWEYTEQGILDKTHLRFFTRRSILSTFERLGYDVKTIEGLNPIEKMKLPGKYRYLNWLLPLFSEKIEDMRYLHFAVVANKL